MKAKCLNCGTEIDLYQLRHDERNLEGFYVTCPGCGVIYDLDYDVSNTFIMDVAKMADYKVLTKEEFLSAYSYVTEDEYDATALYMAWLNADTWLLIK